MQICIFFFNWRINLGKIYAVRKGRETGILESWDECYKSITGFSGAEYKSIRNRADAENYLATKKPPKQTGKTLTAYVDGSYEKHTKRYSFGCVFLLPDKMVTKSASGSDPELAALHNVAGEILGAMYAMRIAVESEYDYSDLYCDYEGLEKWATTAWRAKNSVTQRYVQFFSRISKTLTVRFHKVAAHTGNRYNELADSLAKEALAIK